MLSTKNVTQGSGFVLTCPGYSWWTSCWPHTGILLPSQLGDHPGHWRQRDPCWPGHCWLNPAGGRQQFSGSDGGKPLQAGRSLGRWVAGSPHSCHSSHCRHKAEFTEQEQGSSAVFYKQCIYGNLEVNFNIFKTFSRLSQYSLIHNHHFNHLHQRHL